MKRWVSSVAVLAVTLVGSAAIHAQKPLSPANRALIADFEKRANDYVTLRNKLRSQVPAISKDATAEQIQAFKTALQRALQNARQGAHRGDLFTSKIGHLLSDIIENEFTTFEKSELRKTVLEAANKGVKLKVNAIYPETEELVIMPPNLLLRLPQLPQELRYRFVGRSLVLLDRDAAIILDFLPKALP